MKILKSAVIDNEYDTVLCDNGIEFVKLTMVNSRFILWYLTDSEKEYTTPQFQLVSNIGGNELNLYDGNELITVEVFNQVAFALVKIR